MVSEEIARYGTPNVVGYDIDEDVYHYRFGDQSPFTRPAQCV